MFIVLIPSPSSSSLRSFSLSFSVRISSSRTIHARIVERGRQGDSSSSSRFVQPCLCVIYAHDAMPSKSFYERGGRRRRCRRCLRLYNPSLFFFSVIRPSVPSPLFQLSSTVNTRSTPRVVLFWLNNIKRKRMKRSLHPLHCTALHCPVVGDFGVCCCYTTSFISHRCVIDLILLFHPPPSTHIQQAMHCLVCSCRYISQVHVIAVAAAAAAAVIL